MSPFPSLARAVPDFATSLLKAGMLLNIDQSANANVMLLIYAPKHDAAIVATNGNQGHVLTQCH